MYGENRNKIVLFLCEIKLHVITSHVRTCIILHLVDEIAIKFSCATVKISVLNWIILTVTCLYLFTASQ